VRIVVQRVDRASVDVNGNRVSEIGAGLLLLVGIAPEDVRVDPKRAAEKIVNLRIFEDEAGRMNRSVRDLGGGVLVVSQFTLCADTRRGRRPGFARAAPPQTAEPVFEAFVEALRDEGVRVGTGRFGAKMKVELVNAGPVTLVIEVEPPPLPG
jgi:D-tyrosyl-tRNA(Tyr) deacylase